jgi:hypothetical protein
MISGVKSGPPHATDEDKKLLTASTDHEPSGEAGPDLQRQIDERKGRGAPDPAAPVARSGPVGVLLAMQRAHGNRHVANLIQAGGARLALHPQIAKSGMISRVKSGPPHATNEDMKLLTARTGHQPSGEAGPDLERQIDESKGRGAPLPDAARIFLEPRFGADLGHVRIHTGSGAAAMNRAVEARAFTHGSDIYYGAGESPHDLLLTAHEVTHVLQKTGAEPLASGRGPRPGIIRRAPSAQRSCDECRQGSSTCPKCAREEPSIHRKIDSGLHAARAPPQLPANAPRIPEPALARNGEISAASTRAPPENANPGLPADVGGTPAPPATGGAADVPATHDGAPSPGGAPASPNTTSLKGEATAQVKLIHDDCTRSEAQAAGIAAARRQQVTGQFARVRTTVSEFFSRSVTGVQTVIATRQRELTAGTRAVVQTIQSIVTGTLDAAKAQSDQDRQAMDAAIQGLIASLQGGVQGIAGQIIGLINSVPIPDIPGVAQIKGAAINLLQGAASMVNGALGKVIGVVHSALDAGFGLLNSLLASFQQVIASALSMASSVVTRVLNSVFQALNRVATVIASTLRQVLIGPIFGALGRLEQTILNAIAKALEHTIAALRKNRDLHVEAISTPPKPGAGAPKGGPVKPAAGVSGVQAIAQEAIQNSRRVLQIFEEKLSSTVGSALQSLGNVAAQVQQQLAAFIARAVAIVVAKVQEVVQTVGRLADAARNFLQSLIQACRDTLSGVLDAVRSFVQAPADQLLGFARNALSRMGSFIASFVRNLIAGGGLAGSAASAIGEFQLSGPTTLPLRGPITKPSPGEIVLRLLFEAIVAAAVAALTVLVGEELALVIVAFLIANPLVALVIIVVVLVLVLVLLYLLYKWITKPKPAPSPPGCTPTPPVPFPPGNSKINGPVAPSQALTPCMYGLTFPEAMNVTVDARCDGKQWFAVLTGLVGDFSEQVRLLPGQQEVTGPSGNTNQGNFCAQVIELNDLGHCPGVWYMRAAVQAHEDVHLTRFLPALVAQAGTIEGTFTSLSVLDAPGKTSAQAAKEIQALPAFATAVSNAVQTWLTEILKRVAGDHNAGGPCDQAEHRVVDPMVKAICGHAKKNKWGSCPPVC